LFGLQSFFFSSLGCDLLFGLQSFYFLLLFLCWVFFLHVII
jgi:hypothetical protein